MAKRCSTKTGCSYPRANWWKASMGVDWYGSGGAQAATVYDANGVLLGTTTDDVVLTNILLANFTISRSSTPGAQIGNITDGVDEEPIYAGDIITFTNLES